MNEGLSKLLTATGLVPDAFAPGDADENVFNGMLPAGAVVKCWQNLAKGYVETGYWPVLRGDVNDDDARPAQNVGEILAFAHPGSVRDLLTPRLNVQIEILRELAGELPPGPPFPNKPIDFDALACWVDATGIHSFRGRPGEIALWPDAPVASKGVTFETVRSRKGKPMKVSLVRCRKPYEAPAYLGFGGWNDCPTPELQVAVLRQWRDTYCVVPACITRDVMECVVLSPPQTEADAMELAAEQWIFCDDIVAQGTQSIRNLAIELWRSPRWYFWWD